MKQPQRLTLQSMFETLNSNKLLSDKLCFHNGLAIAIDVKKLFKPFITTNSPYLLEEYRLGVVKRGYMHGIINLQKYRLETNTIVFITPGSIVEPIDVSDDFLIMGIGIPADIFHLVHADKLPEIFNGQIKQGLQHINNSQLLLLDHMFRLLFEIASNGIKDEENNEIGGINGMKITYNMLNTITSFYTKTTGVLCQRNMHIRTLSRHHHKTNEWYYG